VQNWWKKQEDGFDLVEAFEIKVVKPKEEGQQEAPPENGPDLAAKHLLVFRRKKDL
jgi:hypothetical protein